MGTSAFRTTRDVGGRQFDSIRAARQVGSSNCQIARCPARGEGLASRFGRSGPGSYSPIALVSGSNCGQGYNELTKPFLAAVFDTGNPFLRLVRSPSHLRKGNTCGIDLQELQVKHRLKTTPGVVRTKHKSTGVSAPRTGLARLPTRLLGSLRTLASLQTVEFLLWDTSTMSTQTPKEHCITPSAGLCKL